MKNERLLQLIENRRDMHLVVLALAEVIVKAGLLTPEALGDIIKAVFDGEDVK